MSATRSGSISGVRIHFDEPTFPSSEAEHGPVSESELATLTQLAAAPSPSGDVDTAPNRTAPASVLRAALNAASGSSSSSSSSETSQPPPVGTMKHRFGTAPLPAGGVTGTTIILPSAPLLGQSQSAMGAGLLGSKRAAPTFLASFNSDFAYVHRDAPVEALTAPHDTTTSAAAASSTAATACASTSKGATSPRADRRGVSIDARPTISRQATLQGARIEPGGRLGSEPPSLAATPELHPKRLHIAGDAASVAVVTAAAGPDPVGPAHTGGGSPVHADGTRRLRDASERTASVDHSGGPVKSSPPISPPPPHVVEKAELKTVSVGGGGGGLTIDDAVPETSPLAPVTWLKFPWLFLILTVIQVAVCVTVVWFLGDRTARDVVNTLSREIRGEILTQVKSQITSLIVDCLRSADQVYSSLSAQTVLLHTVTTESCVSPYNASYLFPAAVILAQYPTIPQLGYLTPRNVVVSARRPTLISGYLSASSDGETAAEINAACAAENDGSGGCFFAASPLFNTLVSDPDEAHEYLIEEDSNATIFRDDPTLPVMSGATYTTSWPFNARRYERMIGDADGYSAWNPFHSTVEFLGNLTGRQTSSMLRFYADELYAEALAANVSAADLPPNSTSIASNSSATLIPKSRPTYIDAVALGGELGWTRTFLGVNNQVLIAAVKARLDTSASDGVAFVAFSVLYYNSMNAQILANIKQSFRSGIDGGATPNGEVFIFEEGGLLVATTLSDLDAESQAVTRTNILTTTHSFVHAMRNIMVSSGLIVADGRNSSVASAINLTLASSATSRAHDAIVIDRSFSYDGDRWHLRAAPVSSAVGLSWVVIVATLDSDFDAGFARNSVTTGWLSAIVGVVCILLTLGVVQMLTQPLLKLVSFMEDISWRLVLSKDDPSKQNSDLSELRAVWQRSIEKPHVIKGNVDDELAELRRKRRRAIKRNKERLLARAAAANASTHSMRGLGAGGESPPSHSRLSTDSPIELSSTEHHSDSSSSDTSGTSGGGGGGGSTFTGSSLPTTHERRGLMRRMRRACCVRLPRWIMRRLPSVPFQETQLLHRTFGAMLTGLQSSHEMLQTANESKRRFIRYIFHEVRVPFNAIVLGVEQLREDLYTEPLRPVEEMQDVVNILNDQSKVVARILNDVLSLQKIEDGALRLEMAPFNMIELVCSTLRSFQPLLAEKSLLLCTEMENIDQAILRDRLARSPHLAHAQAQTGTIEEQKEEGQVATAASIDGGVNLNDDAPPTASNTVVIAPHSMDVASAAARADAGADDSDAYYLYQNAYEDSKELQRFAESCSREVLGDRYRLRQVLANFLSNAIKFTPVGGTVVVKVSCTFPDTEEEVAAADTNTEKPAAVATSRESPSSPVMDPAPNGAVLFTPPPDPTSQPSSPIASPVALISSAAASSSAMPSPPSAAIVAPWSAPKRVRMRVSVSDTGRGLGASELKQMFLPYVQFQSGEQQQGKGTGLGLNISKSLVELHGGVIGVSSTGVVGQGCEFYFSVPLTIVPLSVSRTSKVSSPTHVSQMKHERSASQLHLRATGTTSAAALAAAAVLNSADLNAFAASPGLRSWHSPRSLARRMLTNSGGGGGSHQHSPAGPGLRRTVPQSGLDEHGNYVDLIPDRNNNGGFASAASSSPNTPLLARGIFHPPPVSVSRRVSNAECSVGVGVGSSSPGAAFTPIVPTGGDLTSNLQYMSQLTFLNELAIQGQGSSNSTSSKVSPLQQYRSNILSQGLPYGVGYSTRPLPQSGQVGIAPHSNSSSSSSLLADAAGDEEATESPSSPGTHPRVTSTLLGLHALAHQHQPRAAVTPASSPLTLGHPILSHSAPPPATFSSCAPLSDPTAFDVTCGVFSTSPFNVDLRHLPESALSAPPPNTNVSSPPISLSALSALNSVDLVPPSPLSADRRFPRPSIVGAVGGIGGGGGHKGHRRFASGGSSSGVLGLGLGLGLGPMHTRRASSTGESALPLAPPPLHASSPLPLYVPTLTPVSSSPISTPSVLSPASSSAVASPPGSAMGSAATSPDVLHGALAASNSSTSPSSPPLVVAPRPKVLVVEDSIPNRKLLMMLLRALKCDPVGVENGLLAVREFEPSVDSVESLQRLVRSGFKSASPGSATTKGAEFGIVLIDGNMPVLDGIAATRAIRAFGWTVPIVAVTGNAMEDDTNKFLAAGADEVLSKPVQRAALDKMLQQFLPGFQTTRSVAQQKISEARNR